jgi:hypothetical protein
MKHLFSCDFKHLWKKRNIIVTFQSGQITEQPKTLDTFRGILICVIFRPRDMQEYYMLFGIFARDTGLCSLSVFSDIARVDFQYTNVYLFCVLHNY